MALIFWVFAGDFWLVYCGFQFLVVFRTGGFCSVFVCPIFFSGFVAFSFQYFLRTCSAVQCLLL